ncbi:hypothetical protein PInf_012338 [Phytophthora infestans]|nr:hypothetical protein PInf_012338 [Phytophthora infestans]
MSPTTGVANTDSELPRRLYGDKLCGMFDVGLIVGKSWMGSGRTGEAEVVEQREGAQKRVVQPQSVEHSANNAAVQGSSPYLLRTQPNLHVTYNGRGKHRLGTASAYRSWLQDLPERQDEVSEPAEVVEQREGAQKRVVQRAWTSYALNRTSMSPTTGVANTDSELPRRFDSDQRTRVSRQDEVSEPVCVCATPWASLYGDKLCGMFDSWMGSGRTGEAEVVEQREGAQKRVVQRAWGRTGEAEVVEQREGAQKRVVQRAWTSYALNRTSMSPTTGVANTDSELPRRFDSDQRTRVSRQDEVSEPVCVCATPWASLYGDKLCGMFDSWMGSGRTGEAEVVEQREGAQKRVVQRAWRPFAASRASGVLLRLLQTSYALNRTSMSPTTGVANTDSELPRRGRTGEAEVVEQREGAQKRVVQRAWGRTGEAEVVEQREGAQKRVVQRAWTSYALNRTSMSPTTGVANTDSELPRRFDSDQRTRVSRQDEVSEPVCVCATPWASLYGDKLCGMFDAEVVEQREGAQKRVVQPQSVEHSANNAAVQGSSPCMTILLLSLAYHAALTTVLRGFSRFWCATASAPDLLRTQPNLHVTYNGRGKHRLGTASAYRSWLQDLPERQDEVSEPVCVCATPWASLYGDKLCGMFDSWMGSGRTGEAEVVEQREGAQKRVVQPALRGFSRFWRATASAPDLLRTQPNLHVTYNGRGKHRLGTASAARLRPTDSSIGPGCKISRSAKMRCKSWMGSGRTGEAEVVEQREGAQKRVVQRAGPSRLLTLLACYCVCSRPLTHSTEPPCHLQRAWQTPTRNCLGGSTPTNGLEYRSWLQDLPERQDEVSEPVCVCATPWARVYGDKLSGMFDVGLIVSESWVGSGRTGEAEVVEQREGAQKRVVQRACTSCALNRTSMSPTTGGKHRLGTASAARLRPTDSSIGPGCKISRSAKMRCPSLCVCATPWANLYGDKLCGMFDVGSVVSESWVGSGRTGEAEVVEQREGAQKRVVQRAPLTHSTEPPCYLQRAWQTPTRNCLGGSTPTNGLEYRSWLQDLPERQDEVSEPVCVCATPWASLYGDKLCGMLDVGSVVSESWVGSGRTGEAEVVEPREGGSSLEI